MEGNHPIGTGADGDEMYFSIHRILALSFFPAFRCAFSFAHLMSILFVLLQAPNPETRGKARTTVNEMLSLNRLPQEIRDKCRSNPAVTRKALINIARKKQTRGMLTAWKKLKEKLAKEESGQMTQQKSKSAATPSDLKDWIDKTNERLAAIDPTAWSDAEKGTLLHP